MALDWRPFIDFVIAVDSFVLVPHMRPDGDALGSQVGLAEALRALGKRVKLVVPSSVPPRYSFLDPEAEIREYEPEQADELRSYSGLIVLDTGTWNQLGKMADLIRTWDVPKAVIDHHLTQDDLGAIRLVDTSAEACGRLVREATRALGVTLTPRAAHALFTALAMDTGWFRHPNTTLETFTLAAELVAHGAVPDAIYRLLYDQNSLGRQRLLGRVLERLTVIHGGRLAYTFVRRADYTDLGATPLDSEDLVNQTLSVIGVEIGVLALEQPAGGTKLSLRARGRHDVRKIAETFGGGGHAAAAGAIVARELDDVLKEVLTSVEHALTI